MSHETIESILSIVSALVLVAIVIIAAVGAYQTRNYSLSDKGAVAAGESSGGVTIDAAADLTGFTDNLSTVQNCIIASTVFSALLFAVFAIMGYFAQGSPAWTMSIFCLILVAMTIVWGVIIYNRVDYVANSADNLVAAGGPRIVNVAFLSTVYIGFILQLVLALCGIVAMVASYVVRRTRADGKGRSALSQAPAVRSSPIWAAPRAPIA